MKVNWTLGGVFFGLNLKDAAHQHVLGRFLASRRIKMAITHSGVSHGGGVRKNACKKRQEFWPVSVVSSPGRKLVSVISLGLVCGTPRFAVAAFPVQ